MSLANMTSGADGVVWWALLAVGALLTTVPEAAAGERRDAGVGMPSGETSPGGRGSFARLESNAKPGARFSRQSPSSTCEEELDEIIREYIARDLSVVPSREDFSVAPPRPDGRPSRIPVSGSASLADLNFGDHCWVWLKQDLLDGLANFIQEYPAPVIITSGYRCPKKNARVSVATNSPHQFGRAVDVSATTPAERQAVIVAATRSGVRQFIGLPKYPRHVHLKW